MYCTFGELELEEADEGKEVEEANEAEGLRGPPKSDLVVGVCILLVGIL